MRQLVQRDQCTSPADDLCCGRQPNKFICDHMALIESLCDTEPESSGSSGGGTAASLHRTGTSFCVSRSGYKHRGRNNTWLLAAWMLSLAWAGPSVRNRCPSRHHNYHETWSKQKRRRMEFTFFFGQFWDTWLLEDTDFLEPQSSKLDICAAAFSLFVQNGC